jgi:predicted secreted protein with PEFG-CTERM motif
LSIVVSYNIANAQECKQLCIAEQFYQQGDTIVIFGKVDAVLENTDVLVQVYRENNRIHIAQVEVAQDGSYTHTFKADGPYFQIDGKYVVQVSYGPVNRYEISFDFQTKQTASSPSQIFEVKAGSSGTFDLPYTIKGGTVKDIVIDPDILGILITIDTDSDGSIILDLGRQWIDAKKIDGTDDTYIILIDGLEVPYEETTDANSRTLTIPFQEGDSDIEVIGTQVVPEFGPIALVILSAAITSAIIISTKRNLFRLN